MLAAGENPNDESAWKTLKSRDSTRENVGSALLRVMDGQERRNHTQESYTRAILTGIDTITSVNGQVQEQEADWSMAYLSRLLSPQTLEFSLAGWSKDPQDSIVLQMVSQEHDSWQLNARIQKDMIDAVAAALDDVPNDLNASLANDLLDMGVQDSLVAKLLDKINRTPDFAHKIPNHPSTQLLRWQMNPALFDEEFLVLIQQQLQVLQTGKPISWTNLPLSMSRALAINSPSSQCVDSLQAIRALDLLLRCVQEAPDSLALQQLFQTLAKSSAASNAFWNMKLGIPIDKRLPLEVMSRLATRLNTTEQQQFHVLTTSIS